MLEFSIVTISVFVSTLNEITKALAKGVFRKDINRFIPLFSIAYGIGLAIAAFYTGIENFGNNIIQAVFIGLSSGAAAVGYHQVGKQLLKPQEQPQQQEEEDPVAEAAEDVEDVVVDDVEDVENVEVEDVEEPSVDDVEDVTDDIE
jgi:hypothetical protein